MARKQRAEQWVDHRRRRDEEERQRRVMVIAKFAAGDPEATLHALAGEILKHRRAVGLLAQAIGWASDGSGEVLRRGSLRLLRRPPRPPLS